MAFVIIMILLVLGLCAIGFGVYAIAAELDGIAGDEAKRRGAEDAEGDAEKKRTLEKWRAER